MVKIFRNYQKDDIGRNKGGNEKGVLDCGRFIDPIEDSDGDAQGRDEEGETPPDGRRRRSGDDLCQSSFEGFQVLRHDLLWQGHFFLKMNLLIQNIKILKNISNK
jgi:hypothetical protein